MFQIKLNTKDLITTGLFSALYIILFFAIGMTGYIPIMLVFLPFLVSLLGCTPIFLLIMKTHKFGVITITGIILSLLMFLTGHPWTIIVLAIPLAIIADIILAFGNYIKWSNIVIGYTIFSLWTISALLPFYFMREAYLKTLESNYGKAYVDTISTLFSTQSLVLILISSIVGSIMGVYLAKRLLRKHFERAGIV